MELLPSLRDLIEVDKTLRWSPYSSSEEGHRSVSTAPPPAPSVAPTSLPPPPPPANVSTSIPFPILDQPICELFLIKTVGNSSVRIWDLILLVPNAIFFLFLIIRFRRFVTHLRRTNSPIFTAFFILVCVANCVSVLRCVSSIIVNNANTNNTSTEDRVMWLILKFFLLATELSVVTFGLLFGHLDSRTSIQRVLIVTFLVSFFYSGTQGTLEFVYMNVSFHNITYENASYTLFGHGGMIFWFVSSVCLCLIYSVIIVLPFTRIQQQFTLPTKKSFFCYCFLLAVLNLIQATGAALLYFSVEPGMCVVNLTAYLYFAGFAPLVYVTFLHPFFATNPSTSSILFSYKLQVDDDDDLSLPHQPTNNYDSQDSSTGGAGGGAGGSDLLVGSVDSTHFQNASPLYAGLNTRPELSFVRDHFAYSQSSVAAKRKTSELQNMSA